KGMRVPMSPTASGRGRSAPPTVPGASGCSASIGSRATSQRGRVSYEAAPEYGIKVAANEIRERCRHLKRPTLTVHEHDGVWGPRVSGKPDRITVGPEQEVGEQEVARVPRETRECFG